MNRNGFTLIEILAVLVILGVLIAVAFKKFIVISVNAELVALQAGITELNGREMMTWTDQMFAQGGFGDDVQIWASMDTDLGDDYSWPVAPVQTGGTLRFDTQSVALSRTAANPTTSARWQIE